jgi:hypothetical protein
MCEKHLVEEGLAETGRGDKTPVSGFCCLHLTALQPFVVGAYLTVLWELCISSHTLRTGCSAGAAARHAKVGLVSSNQLQQTVHGSREASDMLCMRQHLGVFACDSHAWQQPRVQR